MPDSRARNRRILGARGDSEADAQQSERMTIEAVLDLRLNQLQAVLAERPTYSTDASPSSASRSRRPQPQ